VELNEEQKEQKVTGPEIQVEEAPKQEVQELTDLLKKQELEDDD